MDHGISLADAQMHSAAVRGRGVAAARRSLSGDALTMTRVFGTDTMRVELVRCSPKGSLRCQVSHPEMSLVWVRKGAKGAPGGSKADLASAGRTSFSFFPEGTVQSEISVDSADECVGVFLDPAGLPDTLRATLAEPLLGFHHNRLGRAFTELMGELDEPDEMFPVYSQGWALQALAYVARAAVNSRKGRRVTTGGLAPWQVIRAKEALLANLAKTPALSTIARECRLSLGHFARGFKESVGMPPHQWLMMARIEEAQALLMRTIDPLVEIALRCGFADQSHFTRVFARHVGVSPGAWRRKHA
jgi:AraC-like DNA-binding protein